MVLRSARLCAHHGVGCLVRVWVGRQSRRGKKGAGKSAYLALAMGLVCQSAWWDYGSKIHTMILKLGAFIFAVI